MIILPQKLHLPKVLDSYGNFYFNFEELYYLHKINSHQHKYNNLKKKIPKFFVKLIVNFLIFRFDKFVYYLSKTLAFYKFKKLIN